MAIVVGGVLLLVGMLYRLQCVVDGCGVISFLGAELTQVDIDDAEEQIIAYPFANFESFIVIFFRLLCFPGMEIADTNII